MLLRTALKVIAADVVLLVAMFYVVQDLQWRSDFAASARNVCGGPCSYTPSLSYNVLTQFFTMTGNSVQLASPPTLDWVQAIAYVLVVLNAWLAYTVLKNRRSRTATRPQAA